MAKMQNAIFAALLIAAWLAFFGYVVTRTIPLF